MRIARFTWVVMITTKCSREITIRTRLIKVAVSIIRLIRVIMVITSVIRANTIVIVITRIFMVITRVIRMIAMMRDVRFLLLVQVRSQNIQ